MFASLYWILYMDEMMNLEPNFFGCMVILTFGLITLFSRLIFRFLKLKDEAQIYLNSQSRHIQKLYHSLFELEELVEILIEELDDDDLSHHHRQHKNRIKKTVYQIRGKPNET